MRACVRACVRECVRVCVCVDIYIYKPLMTKRLSVLLVSISMVQFARGASSPSSLAPTKTLGECW